MTLLCPDCFGEAGLKKRIEEIRPNFPNDKCTFHPTKKGVPIADVAVIVDNVFRSHYGFAESNQYLDSNGDTLETLVGELVEADEKVTQLLSAQLIEDDDYWPPDGGEPFYGDDIEYTRYGPAGYHHSQLWMKFCQSIVHNQRFFNSNAKALISELFEDIHLQTDQDKNSAVYQLQPNQPESAFYRARLAEEDSLYEQIITEPIQELGPPPERKRRPGRMNPAGVSTFYGAFDLETCIAELRPRVGARIVGARFSLQRAIYVLDTTRFQKPIKPMSLFMKDYIVRNQQWQFMQRFMDEIASPISPDDENLDYIPTQAVAEYLVHHHEFKRDGKSVHIEGVIYKSAQHLGGRNIVLLSDAAKVFSPVAPHRKEAKRKSFDIFSNSASSILSEGRGNPLYTLKLVEGSLRTLRIHGAQYEAREITEADYLDPELDF
jgi:hypothetical protein